MSTESSRMISPVSRYPGPCSWLNDNNFLATLRDGPDPPAWDYLFPVRRPSTVGQQVLQTSEAHRRPKAEVRPSAFAGSLAQGLLLLPRDARKGREGADSLGLGLSRSRSVTRGLKGGRRSMDASSALFNATTSTLASVSSIRRVRVQGDRADSSDSLGVARSRRGRTVRGSLVLRCRA